MKTKLFTLILVGLTGISYAQWSMETIPSSESIQIIECIDGHTCYAAANTDFSGGSKVFKTTDGSTWVAVTGNGLSNSDSGYELTCLDANTCFFGSEGGQFRTIDGGVNWTDVTDMILYPGRLNFPEGLATGYGISSNPAKIVKSTNGGLNWTELTNSPNVSNFQRIIFYNNQIGLVCAKDNSNNNVQIYKTIDGGTNWTMVYNEVANSSGVLYDIQFVSSNVAYACGTQGRILKSTDGGDNWNLLTNPYSINYVELDFINPSNGYVVSPQHIIKTIDGGLNWIAEDNSGGGADDVAIGNLDTVYISSNDIFINNAAGLTASIFEQQSKLNIGTIYPNPAMEQITVNLNIEKQGLEIVLLDLLGNEVKTLALAKQTQLQREGLASGTYLYQIKENNAVISTGKITFK